MGRRDGTGRPAARSGRRGPGKDASRRPGALMSASESSPDSVRLPRWHRLRTGEPNTYLQNGSGPIRLAASFLRARPYGPPFQHRSPGHRPRGVFLLRLCPPSMDEPGGRPLPPLLRQRSPRHRGTLGGRCCRAARTALLIASPISSHPLHLPRGAGRRVGPALHSTAKRGGSGRAPRGHIEFLQLFGRLKSSLQTYTIFSYHWVYL